MNNYYDYNGDILSTLQYKLNDQAPKLNYYKKIIIIITMIRFKNLYV